MEKGRKGRLAQENIRGNGVGENGRGSDSIQEGKSDRRNRTISTRLMD